MFGGHVEDWPEKKKRPRTSCGTFRRLLAYFRSLLALLAIVGVLLVLNTAARSSWSPT